MEATCRTVYRPRPYTVRTGVTEGAALHTTPNMMTAVVQPAYGLDALVIGERPIPSAGPGQLRINVVASAVNPMDLHLARGMPRIVRLVEGLRRPKHDVPGREACGVVDQVGAGVTGFEIGQTVFGWLTGGFAEYAIAEADRMWAAPQAMSALECASLPIAGAAALEAIEHGDVAGKRVLINGASGGVGHYAVQIAKARGASWVAGVCSSKNADLVVGLGADEAIDYGSEDFTAQRWDVIVDCIGNREDAAIRRGLVDDGVWIVVGAQGMDGLLGPLPRLVTRLVRWRFGSQRCRWFVQGEDARFLEGLARLVEDGSVRTHLSATVGLADIRAGYDQIACGRTVGKIAVEVAS